MIEHFFVALVWATRILRHYITKYSVQLVSRLDPLRYLFDIPVSTSRLMRWLVLLPVTDNRVINGDFSDKEIAWVTSLSGWWMYFDGVSNHSRYGIGVLLISSHGAHIPRSVCLAFSDRYPAMNNIVEYETCILRLDTALELKIRRMEIFSDSKLVIRHIQSYCKTRDVKLRPYHAYLELLVERFDNLSYTHLPRA